MAVALKHLDLVAVGVLDEEEARDQLPLRLELLDVERVQSEALEPRMFGGEIVDDEGDMAISLAVLIRFRPILVDRQLDLEIGLAVAEIDEGEGRGNRGGWTRPGRTPSCKNPPTAVRRERGSWRVSPWPSLSFRHGPRARLSPGTKD